MTRHIKSTATFALLAALIILALRAINWLPSAIDDGTLRRYESIEAVHTVVTPVYMPAYFPTALRWPPSSIIAQSNPYRAVMSEFDDKRTGETALVISQSESGGFGPPENFTVALSAETVTYYIGPRSVTLVVGSSSGGRRISTLTWREGPYIMKLAMIGEPFELTRMAESMLK